MIMQGKDDKVGAVFDLLDEWRKFPNYQLERRADIFFAFYLPEVLGELEKCKIKGLIPEFPVRKGLLPDCFKGNEGQENRSVKIDYLGFSSEKAFLIELKTEDDSVNSKQIAYLCAAQKLGLQELWKGVEDLKTASNKKGAKKYSKLRKSFEELNQFD